MKTQNHQKQGTSNFIKVVKPLRKTFQLERVLPGVIVKMPDGDENLYACYEEKEESWFVLERV
jgi:hypothetical protein